MDVGWGLDGLVSCCCFERYVDFRLLLRRLMLRLRLGSRRLMAFNLILKSNVFPSPSSPPLLFLPSLILYLLSSFLLFIPLLLSRPHPPLSPAPSSYINFHTDIHSSPKDPQNNPSTTKATDQNPIS